MNVANLYAKYIYKQAWEPECRSEAFMEGVKYTLNELQLKK